MHFLDFFQKYLSYEDDSISFQKYEVWGFSGIFSHQFWTIFGYFVIFWKKSSFLVWDSLIHVEKWQKYETINNDITVDFCKTFAIMQNPAKPPWDPRESDLFLKYTFCSLTKLWGFWSKTDFFRWIFFCSSDCEGLSSQNSPKRPF